jgi:cytochrome P450
MNTPFLLVRNLDLVKNVLVKDFDSFSENWFALDEKVDPLFAVNPFITHGERWKTDRQHVSPILTMAKLKPLLPLIEDVANNMLEYIDCGPKSNDPNGIEAKDVRRELREAIILSSTQFLPNICRFVASLQPMWWLPVLLE